MSVTQDGNLDLREQIVRIDRAIAEGAKLQAETNKFVAEGAKLQAETHKFVAEAAKLSWDRWIAPVLAAASLVVAIGTAISVYLRH
jgi:hypothetical protein